MMYEGLTVLLFEGANVTRRYYQKYTGHRGRAQPFSSAANWLPLLQNINHSTPASSTSMTVVTLSHPGHQLYLNVYNSTGGHTGYNPAIVNFSKTADRDHTWHILPRLRERHDVHSPPIQHPELQDRCGRHRNGGGERAIHPHLHRDPERDCHLHEDRAGHHKPGHTPVRRRDDSERSPRGGGDDGHDLHHFDHIITSSTTSSRSASSSSTSSASSGSFPMTYALAGVVVIVIVVVAIVILARRRPTESAPEARRSESDANVAA